MDNRSVSAWQYFMLLLSILALAILATQSFVSLREPVKQTLVLVDYLLCAIFFIDFIIQYATAKSKSEYLKLGWLDLISSIPLLPQFRIARVARLFRIIRLFRGIRAGKQVFQVFYLNNSSNTFMIVAFASFMILVLSVILISVAEVNLNPSDAFWWCLFTLVTGEYGEYYPNTMEGKIIALLLMTAGVAIFGTFTATLASRFLEEDNTNDELRDEKILLEIESLKKEIIELRKVKEKDSDHGYHSEESS